MAANEVIPDFIPDSKFVPDQTAGAQTSDFIPDDQFVSDDDKYGSPGQMAVSALEGFGRGATFGVSTGIEKALGVKPEDIAAREKVNPGSALFGEAASFIVPGAPEAELLGKAGAGAARLAGLAEAVSPIAKVGSSAVKMATETALAQSGNEVHKMFVGDPDQSVGTAISDIGLAGLLGAGFGSGFGAISPLWTATGAPKLESLLDGLQRKANNESIKVPAEILEAADRLGVKDYITPEISAGLGGGPNAQRAFSTLQESQTSSGLKIQKQLGVLRDSLKETGLEAKSRMKDTVNSITDSLKDATFAERLQARDELEAIKDSIRRKSVSEKKSAEGLLQAVNKNIENSIKSVKDSAEEEILGALGKNPNNLKAFGEVSLNKAGIDTEETLVQELRDSFFPHKKAYEDLHKPFSKAILTQADDTIADQLAQISRTEGFDLLEGSAENNLVNTVMKSLPGIGNIEELTKLKSRIMNSTRGNPELAYAGKVINNLFEDTIEKVVEREIGDKAPEVMAQWRGTKAAYRESRQTLDQIAQRIKVGKYAGAETFINALENKKLSEDVIKSLVKPQDAELLNLLKNKFPQTYSKVRDHALNDLIGKAVQRAEPGSRINSEWLMDQLDNMRPEYRQFILSGADNAVASSAMKLGKNIEEISAKGVETLNKTKADIELKKLESKSINEQSINAFKSEKESKLKTIQSSAQDSIAQAKMSADEKLKDIKIIMESIHHKSSLTPRNLDKLWSMVPAGATAVAAMLTGFNPALGFLVGHAGKLLARDVPDAIRLAMLKFLGHGGKVEPEAFKTAVDFIHHTIKGENKLSKATQSIFKAGALVMPRTMMPSERDREKLDKRLEAMQVDPNHMLNVGGKTGYYLPDHGMELSKTAMNATNYLNSLRPVVQKKSPFDTDLKPSQAQKAKYDIALDIAQQPLMVMDSIKNGTLTPFELSVFKNLYPGLYKRTSQKLMHGIMEHTSKGLNVPYRTRMNLSLFLGQPLDSTMMPKSIIAAQATNVSSEQPSQSQPQQPKGSLKSLNKFAASAQTGAQASEQRRLKA